MSEELKYCKFCNKQKPKKDFCKSGGFTKNICRECHNKKQKERYANSKLVEEKDKEIEKLKNTINELEIEANKNIQVCNNRGFDLISSIDEVKTLDDFTLNEYIGYLVSLEILDKLNELKGDSSNE